MGRRQHGRLRERDPEISGPAGGVALAVRSKGTSLTDHVLSLQRDYGNAAVTGVVVQRAPKRRKSMAASTDIKDVIKIKPGKAAGASAKKAPAEETFWPEANAKFRGVDTPTVTAGALKWAQVDGKNTQLLASEYAEEAYLRTKARMWADLLWKIYRKVGDKKRADFWLKVTTRQLEPT